MTRDQKIAKALRLRAQGLKFREIAERLGISKEYAWRYCNYERVLEQARARNEEKRQWERDNRAACPTCGTALKQGSRSPSKRSASCVPCLRKRHVEESQTGQIVRLYNKGLTLQQIATELRIPKDAVGPRLHRVRHTDYGKPYIERYGFPEYRRTPEQVARIGAGSRKGQGLAA